MASVLDQGPTRPKSKAGAVVMAGKFSRTLTALKGLAGIATTLVIWQYLAQLKFVQSDYFPSASTVIRYSVSLFAQPTFLGQVGRTLEAMFIGLAVATFVAVPAGLLLGRFPMAYRMTRVLIETMRPIPAVALAPLAILLFGLTDRTTVSLVVWTSVWPVLINSIYGMHNVDPVARDTARTFGFGKWSTMVKIELPSSAPFIATGIRIAIAIAMSVAIAGEMIAGSGNGIGGWIVEESSGVSLLPIYAATIVSGLLGYVLNVCFEVLERKLFFWHSSFRKNKYS